MIMSDWMCMRLHRGVFILAPIFGIEDHFYTAELNIDFFLSLFLSFFLSCFLFSLSLVCSRTQHLRRVCVSERGEREREREREDRWVNQPVGGERDNKKGGKDRGRRRRGSQRG